MPNDVDNDDDDNGEFLEKLLSENGEHAIVEHKEFNDALEDLYRSNSIDIETVRHLLQARKDNNDADIDITEQKYPMLAEKIKYLNEIIQNQIDAIDAGEDPFTTSL